MAQQRFGQVISENHCFALMQIKSDWAWYCEALGLRQCNSRFWMCPFCRACRGGGLSWHDFSLEAPGVRTCRDHNRFTEDMALSKPPYRKAPSGKAASCTARRPPPS